MTHSFEKHKPMKSNTDSRLRALRFESLEQRALLAADMQTLHNFAMPEDADASGSVSPLDALVVINELNRPETNGASDSSKMIDVDADGRLTPLDALVVINFINRSPSTGEESISSVPLEARIARLESAIAKRQLPPAMDIDNARELLETMKHGGRPETGERFLEGRIQSRREVERIETELIVNELAPRVVDAEHINRAAEFIERFSAKLKSAGVDSRVIETVAGEIKAGFDAKLPLTFAQIKSRLVELGVDVTKLFPERPETPPKPETPPRLEPRVEAIIKRLKDAGVSVDVVTTIVTELKKSIEAGSPMTLDQIKARLTELGVDVSKLLPIAPPQWSPSIELVTSILRRVNAKPETVDIVQAAMKAAKESGRPLNASQIVSLLSANRIEITEAIARLLRPVRANQPR